jgi:hypothetical protein
VKRPLGRPRDRWENNIRMDHRGVLEGVVGIHLDEDRNILQALVNTVIRLRFL